MDVTAFIPARNHPSSRYRLEQFHKHFQEKGLSLSLEPLAVETSVRLRQFARRRTVAIVQRKLLPISQMLLLRQNCGLLVYDFDDAVYLRDSFHPRGPYSLTRRARFQATVSLADFVFAGNQYLADIAGRMTARQKVRLIPTCVASASFQPALHSDHSVPRLAWIGSGSTLRSLEQARDLLEEIGRAVPGLVLRVICNRFPSFENLRVERVPWRPETESRDLAECAIGMSVMPDDQWSRGKCGLKVLKYMAAGLPVVADPVGVHRDMIVPGVGFLARKASDWIDQIQALVKDPVLRRTMGQLARDRVRDKFEAGTWGPVLANELAQACGRL